MALSVRDSRHILLITLIVAALPMLVYPNTLGFDIGLRGFFYILTEIAYFGVIALVVSKDRTPLRMAVKASVFFGGRLFMSLVFCIYLVIMERVQLGTAMASAFMGFKPAVFLFTLTSPFVFGTMARALAGSNNRRVRGTMERRVIDGTPRPVQQTGHPRETMTFHSTTQKSSGDFFDRSFNAAVAHVGQYSGVQCVMLVDAEGLPVATWNRGHFDQEMWGGLSRKLVDEITETCAQGGAAQPDTFEFRSGHERFYMQRVADMWLVSIADAASDELEKIRVIQAAEMITRHLNEKYKNVYMTEAGRMYAGSTV